MFSLVKYDTAIYGTNTGYATHLLTDYRYFMPVSTSKLPGIFFLQFLTVKISLNLDY